MARNTTPNGHGLGCVPDLPDRRDFTFAAVKLAAVPTALPKQIDLRPTCPPVYDQGNLGSCTGNALGANFDLVRRHQGKSFMTPSRLFIYYNERVLEGSVDSDSGANLRDGIKVVAKQGVPQETLWPYEVSRFTEQPTSAAYAAAELNQALVYERIAPAAIGDTADMRSCLAAGLPFVSGIVVYASFEGQDASATGIIPMPDSDESPLGGHAITVVGYDDDKKWFICRNSWGIHWGDQGYFYLPYAYLTDDKLAFDAWVIRTVETPVEPDPTPSPTPSPTPNPTPGKSIWGLIVDFLRKLFGGK